MKALVLTFLTLFSLNLYGQNIYMRLTSEGNAEGADFIIFNRKEKISKAAHCSYSILKGSMIQFMTKWGIGNDKMIYWTNGESIYKFNPSTEVNTLVASKLYFILEFIVRDGVAFVFYNSRKEQDADDNRYMPGGKLLRIDLHNGKREDLHIPANLNVTNLNVAGNGKLISFINTKYINDEKRTKYFLTIYNLGNKQLQVIDSAKYDKYEWFGDARKYNSSIWIDVNTLVYYKNVNSNTNGGIFEFDLKNNNKRWLLNNIPERDFSWYSYYMKEFFFSRRGLLYSTLNGTDKNEIYSNTGRYIHDALIQ